MFPSLYNYIGKHKIGHQILGKAAICTLFLADCALFRDMSSPCALPCHVSPVL